MLRGTMKEGSSQAWTKEAGSGRHEINFGTMTVSELGLHDYRRYCTEVVKSSMEVSQRVANCGE